MATRYEKLEEVYQHAFVSNKVRSSHDKSPTRIMLDVSGQHTLRWAAVEMRLLDGALQPVHSKDCNMSLPAGECNLYTFPLVRMDGADALLDGDELHALTELMLALATVSNKNIFHMLQLYVDGIQKGAKVPDAMAV